MSEVFGDDFPDVFSTVLNDAEVAARRQVESATGQLVATLRNRTVAEHERAVRAEREVARLDAHLQTCEAARTNAEVHLYRQDQTGVGTECGRPWTTKEHELATAAALPVIVAATLAPIEALHGPSGWSSICGCGEAKPCPTAQALADIKAKARGDRQARDQLVQAVRVAIREAVPDA